MEINQIIAENIKYLRKQNKMTQEDLGNKIGYSDKTISKWENGDTMPDVQTLYSLANIFGVTIDYFVHTGDKTNFIIQKSKTVNKVLIAMLGLSVIWIIATILFVYNKNTYIFPHSCMCFIWAVPLSCIELLYCNKLWGKRVYSLILLSILEWTVITCIFLHCLFSKPSNNIWLIFLLGIPLQIMVVLWYNIYAK